MTLLLLAIAGCGLISIVGCALMATSYGVGLILLAGMIRNVRQEISRKMLSRILYILALDHALAALVAFAIASLIIGSSDFRTFLALVDNPGPQDEPLFISISLILMFFSLLWTAVRFLLYHIRESLAPRGSLNRELEWEPWLTTLIVVGCVLQLPTLFFFLLISAPLLWQFHRLAKIQRQGNLIWTFSLAVSRGLPLGKEVRSLSEGLWGRNRLRLELLSENLDAGQSIANSLERQPGLVPHSVVMQIRVGEETGTLNQVLANCGAGQARRNAIEGEIITVQQAFMILLVPLSFMPLIVGFLGYYVVPKFKKIFEDFGVENTPLSGSVFRLTDGSTGIPIFVGLGCLVLIAVMIKIMSRDWERDWPLVSLLTPRANAPPILRALALLVHENRTLLDGLQALETSHPRTTVRKQLTRIIRQVEQGTDLWDALAKQRLIGSHDLLLLRAAERVRNLPWALQQIADLIERRHWKPVRVLLEIGFPIITAIVGLVVLAVMLSFFTLPLVVMLEVISQTH